MRTVCYNKVVSVIGKMLSVPTDLEVQDDKDHIAD